MSAHGAPQSGWEKMRHDGTLRPPMTAHDYMNQALDLARPWLGRTSPNPPVGAVLVDAEGRVLSTGVHREAGERHAEVEALDAAGLAARGASLYVTLEPCNHTGRTGPCTEAILNAGVSHVVFGACDPNPNVAGGGAERLRAGGTRVSQVMEEEAEQLIRFFAHHANTGRPWVRAKMAMSLDGRTATRTGASKWITGPEARAHAHQFRAEVDAILVGVNTVIADDPALTARIPEGTREPLRVVLDSTCRTPRASAVARRGTLVATTERSEPEARRRLEETGCEVFILPDVLPVQALLNELGRRGVLSLLVEGGARALGTFFDAGYVQEVHAYVAPLVIGGEDAPCAIAGLGADQIAGAHALTHLQMEQVGTDFFIHGPIEKKPCSQES